MKNLADSKPVHRRNNLREWSYACSYLKVARISTGAYDYEITSYAKIFSMLKLVVLQ